MLLMTNRVLTFLFFAAFSSSLTKADVVFSNVLNEDTDVNFVCGGSAVDAYQCPTQPTYSNWSAGQFVPQANYTLTNAQVIVSGADSSDPTFNVFLYSNAIDPSSRLDIPGSVIEQIGFGLTGPDYYPGPLITAGSISTPIKLKSGTIYWVVLAPAHPTSFVAWSQGDVPFNQDGDPTGALSEDSGLNWYSYPHEDVPAFAGQFVINGVPQTATPEPSSGLMMAAAAVLFLKVRQSTRK